MHFVIQRREQLLNQSVGVLAIKIVRTTIPASVILHVRALLCIANEVQVRWPPEILLSVSVVTLRPFMFLIDVWTKTGFVRINHELFDGHLFEMFFKIK